MFKNLISTILKQLETLYHKPVILSSLKLFYYRNYLCYKFGYIFMLRRSFKVNVTENTCKFKTIFFCVGNKSVSCFENFFVSTMMEEGNCFKLGKHFDILATTTVGDGNTIVNIHRGVFRIFGKIQTLSCICFIQPDCFKCRISQKICLISNGSSIICTEVNSLRFNGDFFYILTFFACSLF